MNHTTISGAGRWFPLAGAICCGSVFILLPLIDPAGRFWGLGHTAMVPLWLRIILGLALMAVAAPGIPAKLSALLEPAAERGEGLFRRHPAPAWAGAGTVSAVIFWLLRDRNLALGDSEHLIKAVTWYAHFEGWHLTFDEALELLLHSAVYRLFMAAGHPGAAETAFALTSAVAGGLFVIVLLLLVRRLGRTALQRLALLVLALSGGYVQLLFGHVENYTVVALLMLLYFFSGIRYLREPDRGLFLPAALLSIAVSFHLLAGWLYPSLLCLWRAGRGRMDRSGKRSDGGLTALAAGALLPLLAAFGLCRVAGFGAESFGETHLAAMKFVFLLGPEYEHYQYGFLSPAHLLDALNLLWLTGLPAALALLCALLHRGQAKRVARPAGEVCFALTAATALQCFALCWNPDLGAFKDWDLFAAAGLGWTCAALVIVSRRGLPARTVLALAFCGLLFTIPWVLGNHGRVMEVDPGLDAIHAAAGHP